jgi:hypothetical protein
MCSTVAKKKTIILPQIFAIKQEIAFYVHMLYRIVTFYHKFLLHFRKFIASSIATNRITVQQIVAIIQDITVIQYRTVGEQDNSAIIFLLFKDFFFYVQYCSRVGKLYRQFDLTDRHPTASLKAHCPFSSCFQKHLKLSSDAKHRLTENPPGNLNTCYTLSPVIHLSFLRTFPRL